MGTELDIRPGQTLANRADFFLNYPDGYTVALDGFLNEPPFFLEWVDGKPYSNFDHHTDVERLATLSSAQQVLRAARMGLADAYTPENGEYQVRACVNDPDQDVILAWYILRNAPDIARQRHKKHGAPIRNLVDMAGDLDVTAGAYPQPPNLALMQQIAWIFRPYTEARLAGEIPGSAGRYRGIIDESCGRIALHLAGKGDKVNLATKYEDLGGGAGWTMFRELEPEGRIGAFRDGVQAFIIYKGQRESGRHDYSLGKISQFIRRFDLHALVERMNRLEGLEGTNRWGCDDSGIVGGSPRETGSIFGPHELITIINEIERGVRSG